MVQPLHGMAQAASLALHLLVRLEPPKETE
jgi:hypothetical protein